MASIALALGCTTPCSQKPETKQTSRSTEPWVNASFVPSTQRCRGPWGPVPRLVTTTAAASKDASAVLKPTWERSDREAIEAAQIDAQRRVGREAVDSQGLILLGKTLGELESLAVDCGQPKYRGRQLRDGIMQGAKSVDAIQTLPKSWREELMSMGVKSGRSKIHKVRLATDGTTKFLLQLADGMVVETVGIPADKPQKSRHTVCVSSQVGCPLRCSFCATGRGGFARNLMAHEIVDQVLTVQEEMKRRVTNVVFMGMGEPLLNLPSVIRAFHVLNKDVGISARSMTISTVGVPNAIRKLAQHKLQSTLAVSLHAGHQELREELVPSAKAYPLSILMEDCKAYFAITGRRVTFEYTLMEGINDSEEEALRLAQLLKRHRLMTHVNLIQWNPVEGMNFSRPKRRSVESFREVLEKNCLNVSVRASRGVEAAAACGQLSNMHQKTPLPVFENLT